MAITRYDYTISGDVTSGIYDASIFSQELANSALSTIIGIGEGATPDDFYVESEPALSAPDKTTLDGIVANLVGVVDLARPDSFARPSVRAATVAALPANTLADNILTASANGAIAAQDGVTLVLQDRILVKNEGTGANNGIYTLIQVGDGTHPWMLRRAPDANTDFLVQACLAVYVEEGVQNKGGPFNLTTPNPITLNTTALTFERDGDSTIRTVTTTPVTLDSNDGTVVVDATGGDATINLPAAASVSMKVYRVKKKDSTGNTVTIDPNGAETIDGLSTRILTTQNQSVNFQSDGTEWWIL